MVNFFNKIFIFIFLLFSFYHSSSQYYNPENLEQLIEKISTEENANISLETIENFILNPLDLKNSTVKQIAEIPAVSFDLAVRIKKLISQFPLINYQAIKDSLFLSDELFYLLTLTTFMSSTVTESDKKSINLDTRARFQTLLNKIKGFEDGKFLGSPYDSYLRIRANYDFIQAGVLFSKDIGEKNLTDFVAGYLKLKLQGFEITLGDFNIYSGMGNILWNKNSFGKGAETIYPAVSFNSGSNGYLSSVESDFFRGISVSYDLNISKNIIFKNSAWFSSRKLSGSLDQTNDTVTSVYSTGLFRTESEINKRNIFSESIIGFKSEISGDKLIIGLSGFLYEYDKFINSSSRAVFYGNKGYLGSLYYLYSLGETRLIGELSVDNNSNPAFRTAINRAYNNIEFVLNFRFFDDKFRSPFGFNFGDSPDVNNESGIYTGLKWKPSKVLRISTYFDFFRSLANTFFIPYFKNGQDFFIQAEWHIDNVSDLRFRLNYESKTDNISDDTGNKYYIQKAKYYSRIEYLRTLNKTLQIRMRTYFNFVNFADIEPSEIGFASSLEIIYKPVPELTIQGRITKFETDSYESAIWQFESPAPGYIYSKALYNEGWRAFISLSYHFFDFLSTDIFVSITTKNNVANLGSNLNQISGNQEKKIVLQFAFNF